MGGMIPLSDASRQPRSFPVVTTATIAVNVFVFVLELMGGEEFVKQWSVIPAEIVAGRHLITIVTALFMHAGWMHIIGNMVFLWAFGPQIEDAMGGLRYLAFYLLSGLAASAAQIAAMPTSTVPQSGCQWRDCGCNGRLFDHLPWRSDTRAALPWLVRPHYLCPRCALDRTLVHHTILQSSRRCGRCTERWRRLHSSCWWVCLWGDYRTNF